MELSSVATMSGASSSAQAENQEQRDSETEVASRCGFDFDCHYSEAGRSIRDYLEAILVTFSTFNHIHNWERKTAPFERLITAARQYERSDSQSMTPLSFYTTVEEVLTIDGSNIPRPVMPQGAIVDKNFLLFTKVRPFLWQLHTRC